MKKKKIWTSWTQKQKHNQQNEKYVSYCNVYIEKR